MEITCPLFEFDFFRLKIRPSSVLVFCPGTLELEFCLEIWPKKSYISNCCRNCFREHLALLMLNHPPPQLTCKKHSSLLWWRKWDTLTLFPKWIKIHPENSFLYCHVIVLSASFAGCLPLSPRVSYLGAASLSSLLVCTCWNVPKNVWIFRTMQKYCSAFIIWT